MQLPNKKGWKDPYCAVMIAGGIALLLLFFFSWRAVLFTAGVGLILCGCTRFRR